MKPVVHVAQVQITKRYVRAMRAQSEGVRHLDGERVQARCIVATTVLPHSCRVGRARVQRQLRMFRPGLYCPSGECQLSKPSPHLPWHYTVLRAYESPKGRGDGKGGWWTSRFRGPSLATKGVLGGTPTPAGSWSRDW